MTRTTRYFLIAGMLVLLVSFALPVFAQQLPTLPNPLGNITSPLDVIANVIKAILAIVGSLALIMFIFGGFLWVTAGGNEERVKKGKDVMLWTSLGLVVIFISYALVKFVIGTVAGTPAPSQGSGQATPSQGSGQ